MTPGAWQGSKLKWSFLFHWYDDTWNKQIHGESGVCWLVGCLLACLTSQQHASVSQGRICSDNFTCCHTEIQVADPTFYLTQSQYTDTEPTSPSADPITPGAWQGSHWSANFSVAGMTRPRKNRDPNPGSSALEADALTTWPARRSRKRGIELGSVALQAGRLYH